jgi:hypothetical protein
MAQVSAIQELKWLDLLMIELHADTTIFRRPTVVFADNQGPNALASNSQFHARSKHIDVQYHFQRQEVDAGTCVLSYIPTALQAADGLTTPLGKLMFQRSFASWE